LRVIGTGTVGGTTVGVFGTLDGATGDLDVPAGVVGCWQAAARDANDPDHDTRWDAVVSGELIAIDLLTGDRDAGAADDRSVRDRAAGQCDVWLTSVVRRWSIDGPRIG
jgi:hypothetical protein